MRQTVLTLLLLSLAIPSAARWRAVRPPARILWIGAHPDDEILLAPLLGRECVERGAACSFLVMTHGESGGSGAARAAEMQRAAAMLHGSLTLWTFADVLSDVDAAWSAEAGGRDALVARIAAEITAASPTVLYTFDPRHGSTCHPAHRALAALVIEALGRLAAPPPVYLLETTSAFASAVAEPMAIDVSAQWSYLVGDAEIHASQFSPAQLEMLANVPAGQRRVYLLDAAVAPRATYTFACP